MVNTSVLQGIRTAQLPIGKLLQVTGSVVLTVNQVTSSFRTRVIAHPTEFDWLLRPECLLTLQRCLWHRGRPMRRISAGG